MTSTATVISSEAITAIEFSLKKGGEEQVVLSSVSVRGTVAKINGEAIESGRLTCLDLMDILSSKHNSVSIEITPIGDGTSATDGKLLPVSTEEASLSLVRIRVPDKQLGVDVKCTKSVCLPNGGEYLNVSGIEVVCTSTDSRARNVNLHVGEVILSVNNISLAELTEEEILTTFASEKDRELVVLRLNWVDRQDDDYDGGDLTGHWTSNRSSSSSSGSKDLSAVKLVFEGFESWKDMKRQYVNRLFKSALNMHLHSGGQRCQGGIEHFARTPVIGSQKQATGLLRQYLTRITSRRSYL